MKCDEILAEIEQNIRELDGYTTKIGCVHTALSGVAMLRTALAVVQQREAGLREALEDACWGLENAVKENPSSGYYASKANAARAALAASEPPQGEPATESWEEELSGIVQAWRDDAAANRECREVRTAEVYDECADEIEALLARRTTEIVHCKHCHAVLYDQAAVDGVCGDCEGKTSA